MDNFATKYWRIGLMAASLCLALVLGASAQSTKPQSEPARPSATQSSPSQAEAAQTSPSQSSPSQTLPSQSSPSQTSPSSPAQTAPGQTVPDQDNGVRPTPDKDTAPQQPATTQESQSGQERGEKGRDHDRDHDSASQSAQSSSNISPKDVKSFDQFLDKHPDIAQELQKDPQKVNDSTYISSHPELSKWLDKHEKVRAELQKDPSAFMNREMKNDKNENKKPMSEQMPMSENPR